MKLIGCPFCDDIIALTRWKKSCKCGKVYGKYIDKLQAKVSLSAIPMALDTNKLVWIEGELLKKMVFEMELMSHDGCDFIFGEFEE